MCVGHSLLATCTGMFVVPVAMSMTECDWQYQCVLGQLIRSVMTEPLASSCSRAARAALALQRNGVKERHGIIMMEQVFTPMVEREFTLTMEQEFTLMMEQEFTLTYRAHQKIGVDSFELNQIIVK